MRGAAGEKTPVNDDHYHDQREKGHDKTEVGGDAERDTGKRYNSRYSQAE